MVSLTSFLVVFSMKRMLVCSLDAYGDFPVGKYGSDSQRRPTSGFAKGLVDPVNESVVELTLKSFLSNSGEASQISRVARLSALLRPLFVALPKDEEGRLGYQTARYALHRFMMQSRGWFIRGLEPEDDVLVHRSGVQTEWVPAYIQGLLATRSGNSSVSLEDLTVMVATLEDLVFQEIQKHLRAIYQYLDISTETPIEKKFAACAMEAFIFYTLTYDLVQIHVDWDPFRMPGETSFGVRRFNLCDNPLLPRMSGYKPSLDQWKQKVLNAPGDPQGHLMSFARVAEFAHDFAAEYYKHNDEDCQALTSILVSMETQDTASKPAQVALSTYYAKHRVGFFAFDEKREVLSNAGILDESSEPPTISVPNYVGSRINCIESSTLYAVCCQLQCDVMLSQLELTLGTSRGKAAQIVDVLNKFTGQDVSVQNRERLEALQSARGGSVAIHSETFASWMNMVFPRDCPQPHPNRSSSRPFTAAEWLGDLDEHEAVEEEVAEAGAVKSFQSSATCNFLLSLFFALAWFFLRGSRGFEAIRPWLICLSVTCGVNTVLGSIPVASCLLMCCFFFAVRKLMRKLVSVSSSRKSIGLTFEDSSFEKCI
eukprot:TRINITY_DN63289_c0_g1_i1.p1 TRINITY_DN63289_c0_g1~~TRINITY_DN63289_c0_g1_i1.p1  ORF type:complete len:597 (-),score=72.30 TRINITY_DN63289_c0_g1_i1:261-2051(-)